MTRPGPGAPSVVAALGSLPAAPAYAVAFSGGLDSSVLLHALRRDRGPGCLRAVHVCHHLHADCAQWVRHCETVCRNLAVDLQVIDVSVPPDWPQGPEAAARDVRYRALGAALARREMLLTAHHAQDQAETFLIQALRGAGLRGLAAMPALAEFGAGSLARPFLTLPRAAIRAYAGAAGLAWIEDPNNWNASNDRAYLRQSLWPVLSKRWPAAAATLSRAAGQLAEAGALQRELATTDLADAATGYPHIARLAPLAKLGPARFGNAIRHWFTDLKLPPPDHRHVREIARQVLNARGDAQPCIAWSGAELRRYRSFLYALEPQPPRPRHWQAHWRPPQPLALPAGCGTLTAEAVTGAGLRADTGPLRVALRRGGERIHLPRRAHSTALAKLLQSAAIAPWARQRLPLLWAGDEIAAVADRWICAGFEAPPGVPGWRLRWVTGDRGLGTGDRGLGTGDW